MTDRAPNEAASLKEVDKTSKVPDTIAKVTDRAQIVLPWQKRRIKQEK
ncbi:hypothetical protein ACQKEY_05670 [Lysinibacillus fusiformis]